MARAIVGDLVLVQPVASSVTGFDSRGNRSAPPREPSSFGSRPRHAATMNTSDRASIGSGAWPATIEASASLRT
jgi:hypothetical protein